MFADNTKLYRQIRSEDDVKMLQEDITRLENWSMEWKLIFHPSKCKKMCIGAKDQPQNNYKLYNQVLDVTKTEKDLGVLIDDKLSFSEHICNQTKKANMIMGVIRRTFRYLDENMFTKLFKALVRPHLEYAQAVWHPSLIRDINMLESVQRRATKQIPNMTQIPYEERLKKTETPVAPLPKT